MLEDVKKYLLGEASLPGKEDGTPDTFDIRMATLTVLVHVAGVDGNFDKDELHHLFRMLSKNWEVNDAEAGHMISVAELLADTPGKVDELLSVVNENFEADVKSEILIAVWNVIKADNVGEFEELIEAREIRKKLGLTLEQAVRAQKLATANES